MAKKNPRQFQMTTTIKQKRKAFIRNSCIIGFVFAVIAYFATNIFYLYSQQNASFSFWLKRTNLLQIIFASPSSLAMLSSAVAIGVTLFMASKGYTRITDDITKEAGTAQWGTIKDFNARYSHENNPKEIDDFKDMILSEHVRMSTDIYTHRVALNTVILGATRSGKSRFLVKPNILQMNCNYVVTDPKGELLDALGPVLQAHGYKVRVFDIFGKRHCNSYNPFEYITCEEDIAILAQQVMDATKLGGEDAGKSGGESPFWDLSTLSALRSTIYLLKYYGDKPEIMGGQTYVPCFASLNLLLALAMEREGKPSQNATLEGSYLDQMFERVKEHERLKSGDPTLTPYCCIGWDQIKGNPLNPTAATIIANTTARLNMFTIDRIKDLTSTDTIDLNNFGEQKDAIFLVMNPQDKTFNFLLNMMYSQLFNSIYRRGNALTGCKYAHLRNGEFVRFWRPSEDETREEFLVRVDEDLQAMKNYEIVVHSYDHKNFNEKDPSTFYYDILDANGVQISARPTMELVNEFLKEMEQMKVEDMSGNMFPFHNRFIIDEFFNVGKIPNFLTVLSTIAGYNGSCDVILQDLGQIKSMYDKDWSSVFGNCPVNLVLKVADNETAKYVSESLGKATIAHAQEKAGQTSLKANNSIDIDVKGRDLMTPDEVKNLDNSQMIVLVAGENPLVDTKHPYTTHPNYRLTSDATKTPFNRKKYVFKSPPLTVKRETPGAAPEMKVLDLDRIAALYTVDGLINTTTDSDDDFDEYDFEGGFEGSYA